MKKLTKIEEKEATAAWEKYHGVIRFESVGLYCPQPTIIWLRAFAEGMQYAKEQVKK